MPRVSLIRPLWIVAGSVSLAIGVVGIVLPLLPTTPFVILAAFCYTRGSERLHRWLATHPRFGPSLQAWRQHGAIPRRAKRLAMTAIALALAVSYVAGVSFSILALQAGIMAVAATFIMTRPNPPG